MKILVIAPHPDDEVLGCGGTIVRHVKQKDEVYLLVATKAYAPDWSDEFINGRPDQVRKVNKLLGITETFFLDFPTVKLDTIPQKELNNAMMKVVEQIKPDVVYVPHRGDLNKDHRLVFESSLVVTRPTLFPIQRILSYEVLSETEWGEPLGEPFRPTHYADITNTLDKKIAAMQVYESELKPAPHPRSIELIEALAKKRGSEAGLLAAEAFMAVREIIF